MIFAGGVNWFVSERLYKVAKETESIALEADALHLKTDVYTSLGVAGGLLLLLVTGIHALDPIIAMSVALFIIRESAELLHRAFSPLLDHALAPHEIEKIEKTIVARCAESISFHDLRTRQSGSIRYIDFHLTMSGEASVSEAHCLCDVIEDDLKGEFRHVQVQIHVESI